MQSVSRVHSSLAFPKRRWVIATLSLLVLGLLIGLGQQEQLFAAEAAKTKAWSGNWSNKKFNTTGELTCTVMGEQNGQWIAKFTGTGMGKPFTYTALMTPKQSGTNVTLAGNTRVDGDTYTWSGYIKGEAMTGSFRSVTGNNGDFQLKVKK